MDINRLMEGLALIKAAISTIKQVLELMPDNKNKADAQTSLDGAERELKIAEATVASELR